MALDQRSRTRFPLKFPVELSWIDSNGRGRAARGRTKDIGSGGAFITLRPKLTLNQPVRFSVDLPAISTQTSLDMVCKGRVVRVQYTGPLKGIAATIESYDLGPKLSRHTH